MEWHDLKQAKIVRVWQALHELKSPAAKPPSNYICKSFVSSDANTLIAHLGYFQKDRLENSDNSDDLTVAWDLATGKELWRKELQVPYPLQSTMSADGKWLAYITVDKDKEQIHVCDSRTGKERGRVMFDRPGTRVCLQFMVFGPDNKTLAIVWPSLKLVLWDSTGDALRELTMLPGKHAEPSIESVAFSPGGKMLAVDINGIIQMVDSATGKQLFDWEGHRAAVVDLRFSFDGRSLITGSQRRGSRSATDELLTWDVATGRVTARNEIQPAVLKLKFKLRISAPSHTVGLAEQSGGPVFVDLANGKTLARVEDYDTPPGVPGVFSPTGRYFVGGNKPNSSTLFVFDVKTGKKLFHFSNSLGWPAFSSDEEVVACHDKRGRIQVVATAKGKVLADLISNAELGDPRIALVLAFSPNGKYLAAWLGDANEVIVWNVATHKAFRRLPGNENGEFHPLDTIRMAWSPDGRMLAVTGINGNKKIQVWEVASGKVRREVVGHEKCTALAFSPNCRHLSSGSADTTVLIWDLWGR